MYFSGSDSRCSEIMAGSSSSLSQSMMGGILPILLMDEDNGFFVAVLAVAAQAAAAFAVLEVHGASWSDEQLMEQSVHTPFVRFAFAAAGS